MNLVALFADIEVASVAETGAYGAGVTQNNVFNYDHAHAWYKVKSVVNLKGVMGALREDADGFGGGGVGRSSQKYDKALDTVIVFNEAALDVVGSVHRSKI